MAICKMPPYRKLKGKVKKSNFDLSLSAILFFMWKAGNLKAYPLNESEYPDNEETGKVMTFEILKLKLQTDLDKPFGNWNRRIVKK